jgi:hypothetical protein
MYFILYLFISKKNKREWNETIKPQWVPTTPRILVDYGEPVCQLIIKVKFITCYLQIKEYSTIRVYHTIKFLLVIHFNIFYGILRWADLRRPACPADNNICQAQNLCSRLSLRGFRKIQLVVNFGNCQIQPVVRFQ